MLNEWRTSCFAVAPDSMPRSAIWDSENMEYSPSVLLVALSTDSRRLLTFPTNHHRWIIVLLSRRCKADNLALDLRANGVFVVKRYKIVNSARCLSSRSSLPLIAIGNMAKEKRNGIRLETCIFRQRAKTLQSSLLSCREWACSGRRARASVVLRLGSVLAEQGKASAAS